MRPAGCVGLWWRGGGDSPCHGNTGAIPNGDGSGKPDRDSYRETGAISISISFGDIRTHFGGAAGHRHSLASGDTNGGGDTDHYSLASGDTLPNPQPDTGSRAPTGCTAVPSGVRHSNRRIRNKTNDHRCGASSKRALAASNPRDRHGP